MAIWLVSPQSNGQHIRYRNIDLSNNSAGLSNYLCAIEKSIYWFHFFSTSNIHILHPHFITRGNNCDRDQCSKNSEKIRKIYNSSHFKRIKILCSSNTNDKFILRWFFSSPLRMMVKFPEDMNDLLVKFYVEKILQFWEFRQMVSYYFWCPISNFMTKMLLSNFHLFEIIKMNSILTSILFRFPLKIFWSRY